MRVEDDRAEARPKVLEEPAGVNAGLDPAHLIDEFDVNPLAQVLAVVVEAGEAVFKNGRSADANANGILRAFPATLRGDARPPQGRRGARRGRGGAPVRRGGRVSRVESGSSQQGRVRVGVEQTTERVVDHRAPYPSGWQRSRACLANISKTRRRSSKGTAYGMT